MPHWLSLPDTGAVCVGFLSHREARASCHSRPTLPLLPRGCLGVKGATAFHPADPGAGPKPRQPGRPCPRQRGAAACAGARRGRSPRGRCGWCAEGLLSRTRISEKPSGSAARGSASIALSTYSAEPWALEERVCQPLRRFVYCCKSRADSPGFFPAPSSTVFSFTEELP